MTYQSIIFLNQYNQLFKSREISIQKAQTLMLERKIDLFFETSALKGDKVDHVKFFLIKYLKLVHRLLMRLPN